MNSEKGIQYDICRTQEDIYRWAAERKYDIKRFSNEYLSSDFCRRAMDSFYSRFQLCDPDECMDFVTPEIGGADKFQSELYFDEDVAGWIGWMYRFLAFETKLSSKELNSKVPFDAMCRYYPGLHTVDEDMAVDIIRKDHLGA